MSFLFEIFSLEFVWVSNDFQNDLFDILKIRLLFNREKPGNNRPTYNRKCPHYKVDELPGIKWPVEPMPNWIPLGKFQNREETQNNQKEEKEFENDRNRRRSSQIV